MLKTTTRRLTATHCSRQLCQVRKYTLQDINEAGNSQLAKDEKKIRSQDGRQAKFKGKVRALSRFQNKVTPPPPALKKPIHLEEPEIIPQYVKPPSVIRKELKEKYGDKVPEAFIKEMIQESQQYEADVKASLRADGTLDIEKFQEEDLKYFISYVESVTERFQESLGQENGSPQKEEDERSLMSRWVDQLTSNVTKGIDRLTDKIAEGLRPSAEEDLIQLFNVLAENIKKYNRDLPLELQVTLFNCAIRLPPGKSQDDALYVAGNIIYLNRGLRSDAFSEARYINTLIKHRNFINAEYLWNSRRQKDVKDQRFWDEIGIQLYVNARNMTRADSLAREILSKYEYIAPNFLVLLIKAYLIAGSESMALEWENIFENLGKKYEFDDVFKPPQYEVNLGDLDDIQGFVEMNKVLKISFEDIYSVISEFLINEKYELSVKLTHKYIKLVPNIEEYLLYKFSELPEELKAGLYSALNSSTVSSTSILNKLTTVLNSSAKSEMELKQLIFKRYLQRKSPLLSIDDFNYKLTSADCYTIIKDFTNRNMRKEVNELITYMQYVKSEIDKGSLIEYALPPAGSVHYIPILQKLGRHKSPKVVERAQALLAVMQKHGIKPGQYFHTQFLLTLYRKKEFKICIDYIKKNFIDQEYIISSYKLLDTIWIIYRDSNRSTSGKKAVRLTSEDVYNLVELSLKMYAHKKPTVPGATLVIETLLATRNFSLCLIYIEALSKYITSLDYAGYLMVHNTLLEFTENKDTSKNLLLKARREEVLLLTQQNRLKLLTKDKSLLTKNISYDLKTLYYLIYSFHTAFWNVDFAKWELQNAELSRDLGVVQSEKDLANAVSLAEIQYVKSQE